VPYVIGPVKPEKAVARSLPFSPALGKTVCLGEHVNLTTPAQIQLSAG